jgi:hypothetical protein
LRLKAALVTVSLPWGLSIGAVGILPYLPLPTKLHTRVLAAMPSDEVKLPTPTPHAFRPPRCNTH